MNPSYHRDDPTPEHFRSLLRMLITGKLDDVLQGKVDLSGVVQQTIWEAFKTCKDWDKLTSTQRISWLKSALKNNLIDEIRKATAHKCDVTREQSIYQAIDSSHRGLEKILLANQLTPPNAAEKQEQIRILAEKIEQLPEDQRQAIRLHHLEEKNLAQTAAIMGKSDRAIAGLLRRGLKKLREWMNPDSQD
jgi:RNA polymerase sigma-70 factor, ECF subfamily